MFLMFVSEIVFFVCLMYKMFLFLFLSLFLFLLLVCRRGKEERPKERKHRSPGVQWPMPCLSDLKLDILAILLVAPPRRVGGGVK